MAVPSFAFLGVVALVAVLLQLFPALRVRRAIMAAANVGFALTFAHDPAALAPFAGLLALGYLTMRVVARHKRRSLIVAGIALMLLTFVWLKRYAFFPSALFLPSAYLTVGMSYVFFRALHLIIDAHQDALPDVPSPIEYLDYTLSFTAFVSGPIQMYGPYRTSESERASLDAPAVARAIDRIATGFFKVGVLSPIFAAAHGGALAAIRGGLPPGAAVLQTVLVLGLYPLFLYFNFSGYTDVVIGASRFLRLELPENFNRPFGAEGSIEFWGRWHMTLSTWLKTYVFSPVLASLIRRYPSAENAPYFGVFAFFVTFFLVGIWHGSTAAFVVFGFMTGAGVSGNKLYQVLMIERMGRKPYRELCLRPAYRAASRGLTYAWYALSMTFFWSSPPALGGLYRTIGAATALEALAILVVVAAIGLALLGKLSRVPAVAWLADGGAAPSALARSARVATIALAAVSVAVVLNAPAPAIVYEGF